MNFLEFVLVLIIVGLGVWVWYLDELEKEGKIKQVGKTGRNVFYVKKS